MDVNDHEGGHKRLNTDGDNELFDFFDSAYELDSNEEASKSFGDDSSSESSEKSDEEESESGSDDQTRDDFYPSDADCHESTIWESDDFFSSENSDSEAEMEKSMLKSKSFCEIDTFDPRFEVGMRFSNKKLLRKAIKSHAAVTKRDLKVTKNDKIRMYIKCLGNEKRKKMDPCKWQIHALLVKGKNTFRIAEYNSKHTCIRTSKVRMTKSSWVARKYLDQFKDQPKMDLAGFRRTVRRELGLNISEQQATRARQAVLRILKRLQKNRDTCSEKWKGLVCSKIMKILNKNMDEARGLIAIKSNDYHNMVEVSPQDFYSVDMFARTCGCRAWNLSGIPCHYAVAAITEQGWDPVEFVSNYYHVSTYKKVYEGFIMPINGKSEWVKSSFIPPLPPNDVLMNR